jgi:hypothetical protein
LLHSVVVVLMAYPHTALTAMLLLHCMLLTSVNVHIDVYSATYATNTDSNIMAVGLVLAMPAIAV